MFVVFLFMVCAFSGFPRGVSGVPRPKKAKEEESESHDNNDNDEESEAEEGRTPRLTLSF